MLRERNRALHCVLNDGLGIAARLWRRTEFGKSRSELMSDEMRAQRKQTPGSQRQLSGRKASRSKRQASPPEDDECGAIADSEICVFRPDVDMNDLPVHDGL